MKFKEIYENLIVIKKGNLTQEEVGRPLGLNKQAVNGRIKRNSKISMDEVNKLAEYFKIDSKLLMDPVKSIQEKSYEEHLKEYDRNVPPEITELFNKFVETDDTKYLDEIQSFISGVKAGRGFNK